MPCCFGKSDISRVVFVPKAIIKDPLIEDDIEVGRVLRALELPVAALDFENVTNLARLLLGLTELEKKLLGQD